MISRRAALGTGAGVIVLGGSALYGKQAGKLDDLAREVGLDPKRLPAESDKKLIAKARRNQSALLLTTRAAADAHTELAKGLAPAVANATAQLGRLGGEVTVTVPEAPADAEGAVTAVIQAHKNAATALTSDALAAVSGDFAQVLASISVSLSQSVIALRAVRQDLA